MRKPQPPRLCIGIAQPYSGPVRDAFRRAERNTFLRTDHIALTLLLGESYHDALHRTILDAFGFDPGCESIHPGDDHAAD